MNPIHRTHRLSVTLAGPAAAALMLPACKAQPPRPATGRTITTRRKPWCGPCAICATLHATTLLRAGVPVHMVAARRGHADPAVTLRIYSHALPEHALGVGDVFAQAVRASVSRDKPVSVCAGKRGGQGRGRTAGLPLFKLTDHSAPPATKVCLTASRL
jgi:hypothetical protein